MERMLTVGLRRVLCEPVAELPVVNRDSRFKNDVSAASGDGVDEGGSWLVWE